MNIFPKLFTLLLALTLTLPGQAQISAGGTPLSFSPTFIQQHGSDERLPALPVAPVNVAQALAADERNPGARFTDPIAVDLSPATAGEWTDLPDGSALWRLKIRSEGALALAFLYDQFYLPPGATLFMYSEDHRQLLGAYTFQNNRTSGKFMTGLISGTAAIIEYYEPAAVAGQGRLHLFRIDRAYRRDFAESDLPGVKRYAGNAMPGFGTSLDCNVNANCPAGESYRKQQRSVCRILVVVEEGIGLCTGTLINNTKQDGTPYVLSGFHCQDGYTPLYEFWRFDFNYESPGCDNPATEPFFDAVLGCQPVAGRQANDMLLLEVTTPIPPSYNVYLAGWNRRTAAPTSAVGLHHPVGDIKKISTITSGIRVFSGPINWNNQVQTPANHHFTMNFTTGTFEVGSSGSSLFDPAGLIVGTLHGGNPSCDSTQAFYARLALAWDGGGTPETRLKDWLDPLGAAPMELPGMENPALGTGALSGTVRTATGQPIAGVTVRALDYPSIGFITGADGRFTVEGLPLGQVHGLQLSRDGDDINGLSALDLVKIQKHILGVDTLDNPYSILAADVNNSRSLTALDVIKISKVILGVTPQFTDVESWRFLPAGYVFPDPKNPFKEALPELFLITGFTESLSGIDFIGIKYGDVNDNAKTEVWK